MSDKIWNLVTNQVNEIEKEIQWLKPSRENMEVKVVSICQKSPHSMVKMNEDGFITYMRK